MNKRYILLLASVLLLGNIVLGQDRDGYEAPPTPKAPKNIVGGVPLSKPLIICTFDIILSSNITSVLYCADNKL